MRTRGGGEGHMSLPESSSGALLLDGMVKVLGRIFSVRLDVPQAVLEKPEKNGKKFCVGLLENPEQHAWRRAISRLGASERLSIAGSLFLARKVLPCAPDPQQWSKHKALMLRPAPVSPPTYIRHVETMLDRMFPVGWDRRYQGHVFAHVPTSSSCLEYSQSKGGARRYLAERGPDWFQDLCLSGVGAERIPCNVKYRVVSTAGKMRGVTVSTGQHQVLGPLHRTLYDFLSGFDWLLRGEARGKKFHPFKRKEGEIFVSGDYESATDNLSLDMTERILSRILSRARFVPDGIREYAMRSLISDISYADGSTVRQRRGQLMGNFLSFPLLCLHNYLAFTYAIPRPTPVRINGDDIVFRCLPGEYLEWKRSVGAAGLTLSEGKTLTGRGYFSLNSSFFLATNSRVREVPIVRLSWFRPGEIPAGEIFRRAIRNWTNESRRLIGGFWLQSWKRAIQKTGRSVERLGIPADNGQLHTAGLAPRESFFRGSKRCLTLPEDPLPPIPSDRKNPACDEWVLTHQPIISNGVLRSKWDTLHREACRTVVWQLPEVTRDDAKDGWWDDVCRTGKERMWLAWRRTSRRCHSLGMRLNIPLCPPKDSPNAKGQWVPRDELPFITSSFPGLGTGVRCGIQSVPIEFVSGGLSLHVAQCTA